MTVFLTTKYCTNIHHFACLAAHSTLHVPLQDRLVMIQVVVHYHQCPQRLFLLTGVDNIHLTPPVAAVADYFGVPIKLLRLTTRATGTVLPVEDGHFMLPPGLHILGNTSSLHCDVDECGAYLARSMSPCGTADNTENAADPPIKQSDTTHRVFDDPVMREAYSYLRFNVRPQRYRDYSSGWKNFKRRIKRAYYYEASTDTLWERRGANRPYHLEMRQIVLPCLDRRVVSTKSEMKAMVTQYHHEQVHAGVQKTEAYFAQRFKFKGLRALVLQVKKECTACSEMTTTSLKMIKAIITSSVLELVMFDLFEMPFLTPDGYKYVLLVKDHFSKYVWGKAFKKKEMNPIADFLYEIFRHLGTPATFHCDNGSEFINSAMHKVMQQLGNPTYTHGRPYNPQTQGLIENANGDVKHKLITMVHVSTDPAHLLMYSHIQARERGLVAAGEEFDWRPLLAPTLDQVNDLPLRVYGLTMTAFMALNGGTPRNMPKARRPSGADVERIHANMRQMQVLRTITHHCQLYAANVHSWSWRDHAVHRRFSTR